MYVHCTVIYSEVVFVHKLNMSVLVALVEVQNWSSPMSVVRPYEHTAADTNPEIKAHVIIVPKEIKQVQYSRMETK